MKKPSSERALGSAISRRKTERLSIELPISIRVLGRHGRREFTRTLDVSRGGASFSTRETYRPGMNLRLGFLDTQNLPGGIEDIPAEVVRVSGDGREGGAIVAIRFKDAKRANSTLSELLRSKIRVASALLEIAQSLSPGAQVEEVIETICRATAKAMEAEQAMLFLRDPQGDTLRAKTLSGGAANEYVIRRGEGLVGQAAREGEVTRVTHLTADARFRPELEPYFRRDQRSVLCVPLPEGDSGSAGLLVVVNKRYSPFTEEDEQLGRAVARQIAAVLREARLFEDIRNVKNYNESILQSIAAGVSTFDPLGNLVTVNRAGAELFGLQARSEIGQHYATLFGRLANPRLCSLIEDVLAKQRRCIAYDVRYLRKDSASFSLNLNALPLRDVKGDFLGGVLVAEDITQEQRLVNTLCRYVAREVAEQVLQDKGALKLGGTRTEVTILFADIRNFTTITEQMGPEDVVNLLNLYYPKMINVIFRYHGMVDKFIGDAILAVFGVPVRREDDPLRAVRAAIEIRKQIQAMNRERTRKNQLGIEIGVGITSGEVISGNIGSERRMDYTVIGDPVNLAARLEGLTKELGQKILVNERVHAAIEKEIPCEALGVFKIKGKQEEVPVFAVKIPD